MLFVLPHREMLPDTGLLSCMGSSLSTGFLSETGSLATSSRNCSDPNQLERLEPYRRAIFSAAFVCLLFGTNRGEPAVPWPVLPASPRASGRDFGRAWPGYARAWSAMRASSPAMLQAESPAASTAIRSRQ